MAYDDDGVREDWYPGFYLDPRNAWKWMPEVFPHWLPSAMVRTPSAIWPESEPAPSGPLPPGLLDGLAELARLKSPEEKLAELNKYSLVPYTGAWASAPPQAAPASWLPGDVPATPVLPVQWPAVSVVQPQAMPPAPPVPYSESARYWDGGPKAAADTLLVPYIAPVPPAPDWNAVATRPTASAADIFARPSGLSSWGVPATAVDRAPIDEAAGAEDARRKWAMRLGQWGRRKTEEYEGYTAPPPPPESDESNPDLSERQRLNLIDSYYRGTLFGSARLALLGILDKLPDDNISPATKRVRDELRREYRQIVNDLARYDRMPLFQDSSQFGAAALGQVLGGIPSPESLAGLSAKGITLLERAGKAALQQGLISGGADPIVQSLNINSGVQDRYDPSRTFRAAGLGALFGAGGQVGGEAFRKLAGRWLPGIGIGCPSSKFLRQRAEQIKGGSGSFG